MPGQLIKKIDKAAKHNYESRSDYIREAVVMRLNNQPPVPGSKEDPFSWENFIKRQGEQSV